MFNLDLSGGGGCQGFPSPVFVFNPGFYNEDSEDPFDLPSANEDLTSPDWLETPAITISIALLHPYAHPPGVPAKPDSSPTRTFAVLRVWSGAAYSASF